MTDAISAKPTEASLEIARWAICAAFFANGFTVGHWAPKIPVLVERLGISEALLGQMIILFGVGALIALIGGAVLVNRFGSRPMLRITSLMLAPSLVLLTVMPNVLLTTLAMLWLGMFLGAMDNAMNANGVSVETGLGRPVMSSYHGFWSLGGVAGGLTGGAMIAWMGELGHALAVAAMTLAIISWAWPRYVSDREEHRPSAAEAVTAGAMQAGGIPRAPGIYLFGIMTMMAFAPEGTVIDWSALYLKDELGAPLLISGYAFAAFSMTMAVMRLTGDRIRTRFGDRPVLIASCVVAALGLFVAGQADSFLGACAGFFIAGLGMANTVPVLFSVAGRYPGIKPASAIAVITAFGYGGLLFIPAFVGFVAEHWSLGLVFSGWAVILLAMGAASFVLPHITGRAEG